MTTQDRALLRELEEAIPPLEEQLRAMKATRNRLKAAETIARNRRTRSPTAATLDALRRYNASPEGRARARANCLAHNDKKRLPWVKGTKQYRRYKALTRTGVWTREAAIAKVTAETRA